MKKLAAALLTIALLLTTGCSGGTSKETGNVIARHSEDEDGLYYGNLGDTMRNEFFDFIVEDAALTLSLIHIFHHKSSLCRRRDF